MKNLISILGIVLISLVVGSTTEIGIDKILVGAFLLGAVAHAVSKNGVIAMSIPTVDAAGFFTKKVVDVYKEETFATSFLTSFFRPIVSMTREVSIAVRRGTEKIAVDVERYSDGNRNKSTKSTEKIFIPPYYNEWTSATDHQLYHSVITEIATSGPGQLFSLMTADIANDVVSMRMKIERAIEKQCADVFETGIITLSSGDNIDFGRQAGSLVANGAGNTWSTGTVDPYENLADGCQWLRENGKMAGARVNAIMGSTAYSDFLNNTIVKARADVRNYSLDQINAPVRNSLGASYMGDVACGSYIVSIWTYPEIYTDAAGATQKYVNDKKVILLPETTKFDLVFAAVPQMIKGNTIPQKGEYLIQDFMNEEQASHKIYIKSAPIAVPVGIDQIYTFQPVA